MVTLVVQRAKPYKSNGKYQKLIDTMVVNLFSSCVIVFVQWIGVPMNGDSNTIFTIQLDPYIFLA